MAGTRAIEPTVAVASVTAVRVAVTVFFGARCEVTVLDATRATPLLLAYAYRVS